MRNTIGQAKSAFNVREVMDNKKNSFGEPFQGEDGDAQYSAFGAGLVAQIQMAAMSRADMPEADRKDFYLYVDEFQNFATDTFSLFFLGHVNTSSA